MYNQSIQVKKETDGLDKLQTNKKPTKAELPIIPVELEVHKLNENVFGFKFYQLANPCFFRKALGFDAL